MLGWDDNEGGDWSEAILTSSRFIGTPQDDTLDCGVTEQPSRVRQAPDMPVREAP
ncbi:MAG: hypothetical protein V1715_12320 [bacterium]